MNNSMGLNRRIQRFKAATTNVVSFLCLVTFFLFCAALTAQAQTGAWDVVTVSNDTLRSCDLIELKNNLLILSKDSILKEIRMDSMKAIIHHQGTRFWVYAGRGALIGLPVGGLIGAIYGERFKGGHPDMGQLISTVAGCIIGPVAGFIVGGIWGLLADGDVVYDLTEYTSTGKSKRIRSLLPEE